MSGAQRVSDLIKRSPSITIIADLRYVTNWRASKIGRSNSGKRRDDVIERRREEEDDGKGGEYRRKDESDATRRTRA